MRWQAYRRKGIGNKRRARHRYEGVHTAGCPIQKRRRRYALPDALQGSVTHSVRPQPDLGAMSVIARTSPRLSVPRESRFARCRKPVLLVFGSRAISIRPGPEALSADIADDADKNLWKSAPSADQSLPRAPLLGCSRATALNGEKNGTKKDTLPINIWSAVASISEKRHWQ